MGRSPTSLQKNRSGNLEYRSVFHVYKETIGKSKREGRYVETSEVDMWGVENGKG